MLYMLLVTALVNGHPDTQGLAMYIDKADCEKALSQYKADNANVLAVSCLPVEEG